MNLCLVVISDGRVDYLQQTLASLEQNVDVGWCRKVIVDDSGELKIALRVQQLFPDYELLIHPRRSGVAAAVQTGWGAALDTECDGVFHLEQDFTFNLPVPVERMCALLDAEPHLANMVLKRQPYSPEERAVGDFMRYKTDLYEDVHTPHGNYVAFDALFSCNPSIIRRKVLELAPFSSEREFADTLKDHGYRFAFWGQKADPPMVTHIGDQRALGWLP